MTFFKSFLCAIIGWAIASSIAIAVTVAVGFFTHVPVWVAATIGFSFGLIGPYLGYKFAENKGWS